MSRRIGPFNHPAKNGQPKSEIFSPLQKKRHAKIKNRPRTVLLSVTICGRVDELVFDLEWVDDRVELRVDDRVEPVRCGSVERVRVDVVRVEPEARVRADVPDDLVEYRVARVVMTGAGWRAGDRSQWPFQLQLMLFAFFVWFRVSGSVLGVKPLDRRYTRRKVAEGWKWMPGAAVEGGGWGESRGGRGVSSLARRFFFPPLEIFSLQKKKKGPEKYL